MKKYLVFIFCLVFTGSLVSFSGCEKGSGRSVQLKNTNGMDPVALSIDDKTPTGSVDAVEQKEFTEIRNGAKFIFNGYELLDGGTKCKISITSFESKETVVLILNIADPATDSMQINAVPIGTFYGNKIFSVITRTKSKDVKFLFLFCGTTSNCVSFLQTADQTYAAEAFVGFASLSDTDTKGKKYWILLKDRIFSNDKKTHKTNHLCMLAVSENPF